MKTDREELQVSVESIYGVKTKKGLVRFQIGNHPAVTMLPEIAREVANMLLQAAEGAENDEFMVQFATEEMKAQPPEVVALLRLFRESREKYRASLKGESNTEKPPAL